MVSEGVWGGTNTKSFGKNIFGYDSQILHFLPVPCIAQQCLCLGVSELCLGVSGSGLMMSGYV